MGSSFQKNLHCLVSWGWVSVLGLQIRVASRANTEILYRVRSVDMELIQGVDLSCAHCLCLLVHEPLRLCPQTSICCRAPWTSAWYDAHGTKKRNTRRHTPPPPQKSTDFEDFVLILHLVTMSLTAAIVLCFGEGFSTYFEASKVQNLKAFWSLKNGFDSSTTPRSRSFSSFWALFGRGGGGAKPNLFGQWGQNRIFSDKTLMDIWTPFPILRRTSLHRVWVLAGLGPRSDSIPLQLLQAAHLGPHGKRMKDRATQRREGHFNEFVNGGVVPGRGWGCFRNSWLAAFFGTGKKGSLHKGWRIARISQIPGFSTVSRTWSDSPLSSTVSRISRRWTSLKRPLFKRPLLPNPIFSDRSLFRTVEKGGWV